LTGSPTGRRLLPTWTPSVPGSRRSGPSYKRSSSEQALVERIERRASEVAQVVAGERIAAAEGELAAAEKHVLELESELGKARVRVAACEEQLELVRFEVGGLDVYSEEARERQAARERQNQELARWHAIQRGQVGTRQPIPPGLKAAVEGQVEQLERERAESRKRQRQAAEAGLQAADRRGREVIVERVRL
jgi:hypothetical protein